jgi:hypothetical protein
LKRAVVAALVLAVAAIGSAQPVPLVPRTFVAGPISETAIVAALAGAHADRFRPVGTTSVTFQVDLAGTIDAAFKPESHLHPRGWLNEVAAYRIARELGLDDVPPAVVRSVDRGQLRRRVDVETGVVFDELENDLVFTGSQVRGAFIYWVPGLQRSDLDTPEGITRWSAWLAQGGEIPEDQRTLARDLSNTLLFDYLIGNRDRWTGGNVRPVDGGRLVIRDHNLAFPVALGEGVHARMLSYLQRSQRFSASVVERLVAMDETALRAAVEDHEPSRLLDDRQIDGVLQRRAAILSYVGALVEAYGSEDVLHFE